MRLLLLSTGGTIGSTATAAAISTDEAQTLVLLEQYAQQYGSGVQFVPQQVCSILSENADDRFYEKLIAALQAVHAEAFDGIIVLHGTDTISYTAALCAMACRDLKKPVCFVSSAYVLSDPRQNGVCNLHAAVQYVASGGAGFVVPYRNGDGRTGIYLATRLQEVDAFSTDISAPRAQYLAECNDEAFCFASGGELPSQSDLRKGLPSVAPKPLQFSRKILLLQSYPSIDFTAFSPNVDDCAAVLVTAYHSGTAPQEALAAFAKSQRRKNIAVYLAPVKRDALQYESTHALLQSGVQPIFGTTKESALARLKIAYNQAQQPPEQLAQQNLYFEEIQ